jgi:DNA-binding beta-propeller fold protein YncE
VGTNEFFTFTATVNNPGCNVGANPTCLNVTWSLPTNVTGDGTIVSSGGTAGIYTAPTTVPSPSIITITATSVADTTVTATASVTVVTASTPTVTSVSPNTAALGSLFQDFYITGTNFISTDVVYVNGYNIPAAGVSVDSSSVIRARIPTFLLSQVPASGIIAVTVSEQTGAAQTCTDPSQCQIVVTAVRPAIVGPTPISIPQGTSGVLSFNVNGGFYGTATNPTVIATFDGQSRVANVSSTNPTRQLTVNIGGPATPVGSPNPQDFSLAGLHQVTIASDGDPTKFSSANLAVQPDAGANPPTLIGSAITVGTTPSDVAIDPATGIAVVANSGSNDVTLVNMGATSPAVILQSLCTGAIGAASAPCSVVSGPKSVAVAHLINPTRDVALVVNSATMTISEIDLNAQSVIWVSSVFQDVPVAVGMNPVTGRALVAMNNRPYGILIDVTQTPPAILGPVSISTGPNSHVAVEPHLNWAIATPGNAGSVGIVDLNRQTTNNITNMSRTTNVVTVTIQPSTTAVPQSPLALVPGDAVQIQVQNDTNSFSGIYQVTSQGPGPTQFTYTQTGASLPDVASITAAGTVNYAKPVATLNTSSLSVQGIGINTETQSAILTDPSSGGVVQFFNLIDQSVSQLTLVNSSNSAEPGSSAGAFNPLTNTAYVVNQITSTLSVIDPSTPKRLPSIYSTFPTGNTPVAVQVDPASNRLIVVNQGDNTVGIYTLGASNTIRPIAITESNPKVFTTTSTLSTAPTPAALTLTVLGAGLTCTNNTTTLVVRLDAIPLSTSCPVSNGTRQLLATVPPSLLASARRFDLDVQDTVSGTISNASDFTVEQSIDMTSCAAIPLPSGVAIDQLQNIAVVSLAGCNQVALINLATATGTLVTVGSNPLGVAVLPRLHWAVVANNGSNNASIVDELGATVEATYSTDSGSVGVAVDQDTGEAAVTNSVANDVTVLNVTNGNPNSVSTGQTPVAVGFNYQNHEIAVAAAGSSLVDVSDASASSATQTFTLSEPTSVVYDPLTGDLANDCDGTSSNSALNQVGCFLVNSSTGNIVQVIDPTTSYTNSFGVGINPTAIAYNPLTGTLVSTNTLSHTVTVADFIDKQVRAVLTLPPAPPNASLALTQALQFSLDIHPLTNIAVIADTVNGRVLLVPIPR